MEDGVYCASIPLLRGCKGYADSPAEAIAELQGVKESLLELMLKQGKEIPEPTVRLEIPISNYSRLRNRRSLDRFIKSTA
jgi:predicted RNase H-like HicB family nuclease